MLNPFKRKLKPKKLTLRQIHSLYLLLRHALPKKEEKYLIDQIQYILQHAEKGTVRASLNIMYELRSEPNPIQAITLFTKGLQENGFFDYVAFLKGLRGISDG